MRKSSAPNVGVISRGREPVAGEEESRHPAARRALRQGRQNAGESRIPLPRTVRPSLLPKLRSLGPAKIGVTGHHRRSPIYCAGSPVGVFGAGKHQQQQQHQLHQLQQQFARQQTGDKPIKGERPSKTPTDAVKDKLLNTDYSISAIWTGTAENKEVDQLMRLSSEKLGILRSHEDLSSLGCIKKSHRQSREDVANCAESSGNSCSSSGGSNALGHGGCAGAEYAIESPITTTTTTTTTPHYLMLNKQNSFEHDESSLGILTPDQMTDFTVALESSRTPSCENLLGQASAGKFLLGKSNALVAAAARHLDIASCVPSIEALLPSNDRSPSLEELPLDPKPTLIVDGYADDLREQNLRNEATVPKLQQPLEISDFSSKTIPTDSTETSEHTSEQARSSATTTHILPTSFITSVTSITSLEAGYQGDGENSRPASRGPEPLSIVPVANLIVGATCRQDPMTDSDFFTESDADAHEEIGRGDRRAQVIDGTLFCAPNEQRCPSFEPCEEMDSSGIYSDLDKRQDSVGVDGECEGELYGDAYGDGDHTTDTGDTEVSMKSQLSPQEKMPVAPLSVKNVLSPQDIFNDTNESHSNSSTAEVTIIKCQKNEQNTATKSKSNSISNKENSIPLKKYKMPKRNVISKIKTMIESNQNIGVKEEPENESRRIQRQQRKTGRWDAVMNKIEANKQRGRSLKKEVKSRVLQGLGTSSSSTASTSSTRRPVGDSNNNANNNKDKRRARGRVELNSPNQETARSSVRSSASDLSSAHSKEILKRPQRKNCLDAHQTNNNQLNGNIIKPSLSNVRKSNIKNIQSNVNAKQKNAATNKVADRSGRTIPSKEQQQQLSGPGNGAIVADRGNSHQPSKNNNHNHNNNNNNGEQQQRAPGEPTAAPAVTRERASQTERQQDRLLAEEWIRRAEDTVQALALTVQYLARRLEDLPDCRLRREFDKMKADWLSARSELEELRLRKTGGEEAFREELEQYRQALVSLREKFEHEQANLELSVLKERHRADELQVTLQECEREHRATLERLASKHELELSQLVQQHEQQQRASGSVDQTLFAEVESLRTVLELRSQENAQMRSEVDILRREMDDKELVKQRCESLEARCEDLKAQLQSKEAFERQLAHENEVLLGSIHQMSKQNKRLSQRNEELLWRLRQKSEVVSVLTNQLTPQTQRLSKSLGPENNDHPSIDANCSSQSDLQSCSMVKYMVEKSDSVSWTLDITENMDCSTSSNNGTVAQVPTSPSSRRYHNSSNGGGGTGISRQGSLRLSMPRRSPMTPVRAQSNSVSVAESGRTPTATTDELVWSPSYNSTPLQRRRNVMTGNQAWPLSNTTTKTTTSTSSSTSSSGSVGRNIVCNNTGCSSKKPKILALEVSTTDEEDEGEDEMVGQRPQEAGGEAMISEETSVPSSSEDESSVSSSDIP